MQTSAKSNPNTVHALPPLEQPEEKIRDIAQQIGKALGQQDQHSARFHLLVASRVPEKIIHAHLADIRADGARNPGALFTYRMNRYAKECSAAQQPSLRQQMEKLSAAKHIH